MSTHNTCGQARWPSVACRYDRLSWIIAILKDEGIEVSRGKDFWSIAKELLKAEAQNHGAEKETRISCFKAGLILERI